MTVELVATVRVSNTLGEGVLWNENRQTVWWTDIQSSQLFEYDPNSGVLNNWDTPHRVACFSFVEGGDQLVVAFESGIALYDVRTRATDWIVEPGFLPPGIRLNDGKVDPEGRFWVGSMVEQADCIEAGALYRLDRDVGLVEQISGITIANGLCWSPDGRVMYHADSPTHTICAYRFDAESGSLSERRVFATTRDGVHPDGASVDAAGGVWSAQWGGGQVVRYTTNGESDLIVELPVSQPTCVAFGGADNDLMFVTSARQGLSADELATEPDAGDMFIYRTGFEGVPPSVFKLR